jgi:predicted GH43/DUF377 family glycosyl hydrolase
MRPLVPAVLLALLAGCSSTTGSPSPTVTPLPVAALSFTETEPVVTRELSGLPDERYINPGALIEADGTYHLYPNAFSTWPGLVQVPHLTSGDGVSWEAASDGPVLTSEDIPFGDEGADVSTGYVAADGTWVLIFETVSRSQPWVLGMATAPGPDGPWTIESEPILAGGAAGSWDAGGLSWPSVVQHDGEFLMYFTGLDQPRGGLGAIGLARSTDGLSWTKKAEPVLSAELQWEARSLDRPRVAATDKGLVMVYSGRRLTDRGVAWSQDGVSWQRQGEEPVIRQADFPAPGGSWDAAIMVRDGTLHYYLEIGAGGGTSTTDIYLATARVE